MTNETTHQPATEEAWNTRRDLFNAVANAEDAYRVAVAQFAHQIRTDINAAAEIASTLMDAAADRDPDIDGLKACQMFAGITAAQTMLGADVIGNGLTTPTKTADAANRAKSLLEQALIVGGHV